jgi:hypothetical protein
MKIQQTPYIVNDAQLALDCARGVPAPNGLDGTAIAGACGTNGGELVVSTCRIAGAYDCGFGDYPSQGLRQDLAALTGVAPIFTSSGATVLTGRFTESQRATARQYIKDRLIEAGATASLNSFTGGANVVGILASNTTPTAKPIVVGGHFDTIGEYQAGAVDNGVGVALMLDAARLLGKIPLRKRPVYFVAFDLEESGLRGSKHFVETFKFLGFHSAHMADQIGGDGANLNIEANSNFANLTDCMWNMYQQGNSTGQFGIPLTRVTEYTQTDSTAFLNAGIRAINVSTMSSSGTSHDCIKDKPCDAGCLGNCAAGNFCTAINCQQTGTCYCDSYHGMNFDKVASVALLFRHTLQRLVTGADTSCL